MRRTRLIIAAGMCGLIGASCNDVTGPDTVSVGATGLAVVEQPLTQGRRSLRVAQIGIGSQSDIVVPATARVGEAVTLRVTTYGNSCVSDDRTDVKVVGRDADVVPYQNIYLPKPNGACGDILRVTARVVSLVFTKAGTATVTIIGRGTDPDSGIVRVVRRVVVE